MVPSGTRVYLWNFDCEPSKESLTKQTVEDAAERCKRGRISMRSYSINRHWRVSPLGADGHFPLSTQSEDLY